MPDLTPEALDQLETLARDATQDAWSTRPSIDGYARLVVAGSRPIQGSILTGEGVARTLGPDRGVNAEYIAAAQPATILALIAEVRRLRETVALLHGWEDQAKRDAAKIEHLRDACRNASQDDWGLEYLYVSAILRTLDGGAS